MASIQPGHTTKLRRERPFMAGLRILDLQAARSSALPWPDVYFTPQYGRCVEESDDARWELAVWEPGPILYPYLVRPVPAEIQPDRSPAMCDIVSPYGYAGPWAHNAVEPEVWSAFRRAFRDACRQRGAVAEFVRFHPLFRGREFLSRADSQVESVRCGATVSVDLRRGYQGAWKRYEGRQRTAVRKAQRLGYSVRVRTIANTDAPSRARFRNLYESTMQGVGATAYYSFSDAYYELLWNELGTTTLLAEIVSAQGETVAAALFFVHGDTVHYHLAGSVREHARQGVNNLLLDAMVAWGATRDRRLLHLGGGVSGEDSLFKFKASIGQQRHEFWIGKCVLDSKAYEAIVRRAAKLRDVTVSALLQSSFFPVYRAPAENAPAEVRT